MRINRLLQLIIYLMSNQNVTVRQLSERFGVSRKTIYKDLEVLITSGIPVVYGEDMSGRVEILEGFDVFKAFKSSSEKVRSEEAKVYKKYVNNEAYLKQVSELWEAFTKNLNPDLSSLREDILHSWVRCQRNGVSIHEVDQSNLLPPEDVHKYEIESVLGEENPNAILFSSIFKKINWYGSVCDKNGKLVYLINPMEDYHVIYPQVGYNIDASESVIGTNGVSIALEENRVTMVLGSEHYNKSFHQVCCVAAPIYKDEKLVGVVNASFVHTEVNEQVKYIVSSFARLYEALILNQFGSDVLKDSDKSINRDMSYIKNKVIVPDIIGDSVHIKRLKSTAKALATADTPVSIVGESGVGKKTVARYIHSSSNRKFGPCIELNCASIDDMDHKAYIFGSEMADSKTVGVLEKADGGSLIIENFSQLPENIQIQLGKFLSEGRLRRKGSKKWREYDVRLFIIVHPDEIGVLSSEVICDLMPLMMSIKPLRNRKNDIGPLVSYCLDRMKKKGQHVEKSLIELVETLEKSEINGNVSEVFSFVESGGK